MAKFKHAFRFTDGDEVAIDADLMESNHNWLRLIDTDPNGSETGIMVGVVNAALVRHVIITPIVAAPAPQGSASE